MMATGSGRPPGRPRRWSPEAIEETLRELHRDRTTFLSVRALLGMGHGNLVSAINRNGGLDYWAKRVGLPRSVPEVYSLEAAKTDAEEAIARFGLLPGTVTLRREGYDRLASFIQWHFGNRRRFLTALGYGAGDVAVLTGVTPSGTAVKWTPPALERELRAFLGDCQQWPPDRVFRDAGRAALLAAVRARGGKEQWAQVLGIKPPARRQGGGE